MLEVEGPTRCFLFELDLSRGAAVAGIVSTSARRRFVRLPPLVGAQLDAMAVSGIPVV